MHAKLKVDLITGFLQEEDRFSLWKEQFRVYGSITKVINGTADGYFDLLEEKGLIDIGDYAVLRKIFENVDKKALGVIDKASANMKKAIQNNKNKS